MTAADGAHGYLVRRARVGYGSLVDTWMLAENEPAARECAALAVKQGVWPEPMQRARDHVPGLTARPLHDPTGFWFTGYLEEHYPLIRAEIDRVLDSPASPVLPTLEDGWLTRSGSWQQAHLFRDGRWQDAVCAHFPVTTAILAEIPEVTTLSPGVIMISRLTPGTRIMPHCGSTNAVLRIHLGITIPAGVTIRVADQVLAWQEGKCLVFDDAYEHEVRHDGAEDRVVLILDMAHPDLAGELRDRLLARRPLPEDRIVAFMRERGLGRIGIANGRLEFAPDPATRDRLAAYLAGAGATGVRLDGDELHWQRAADRG